MRLVVAALLLAFGLTGATAQSILYKQPLYGQPTGGCLSSAPLPGDAMPSGSVTAAYGTCALFKNYLNGNFADVTAQSRTVTIKFINGYPDVNTLASLMGINPRSGIGGLALSKWYDQSGNGNNCTQSAPNQPVLWLINGKVFVAASAWYQHFVNSGTTYEGDCVIPGTASFNNQSISVYSAHALVITGNQFGYAGAGSTLFTAGGGPGSGHGFSLFTAQGAGGMLWGWFNWLNFGSGTAMVPETMPVVVGFVGGSGGVTFTQNEESSSGSALPADTATGGWAYGIGPNSSIYGRAQAFMVANIALSSAQQTAVRNAMYARFGIAKAPTIAIEIDGASYDSATGSVLDPAGLVIGYGSAEQQRDNLSMPLRFTNTAVFGATIAQLTTNFSTSQALTYGGASFKKNIFAGPGSAVGNSITGGETGAQAFSDLQTYITAVKAAGSWSHILVSLTGSGSGESQNYNNLVIANAATLGITPVGTAAQGLSPGCPINGVLSAGTLSNATYYNQTPSIYVGHPTLIGWHASALCTLPAFLNAILN